MRMGELLLLLLWVPLVFFKTYTMQDILYLLLLLHVTRSHYSCHLLQLLQLPLVFFKTYLNKQGAASPRKKGVSLL